MINDFDIKKLEKTFATKKDLKETEERLNKGINRVIKYIDFKLEPVDNFKKEFVDFKERVLNTLDWLVGAFKKFDEEHQNTAFS